MYAAFGFMISGLFAYTFYRSVTVFALLSPAGLTCILIGKRWECRKRLGRLKLEFKEGITILAASLSAGYSVENAFSNSVKELGLLYGEQAMITKEFAFIVYQVRMNRPAELAVRDFAIRSGLEDVRNFADVFSVAKRSGGELVAIIDHTAGLIREKIQVEEEIATLTASRKFEQKIMNMIPFFIVVYIDTTSPGYFTLMYHTVMGRILMTVCMLMYLLSYGISKKILDIDI